jgi:hypothetical protein
VIGMYCQIGMALSLLGNKIMRLISAASDSLGATCKQSNTTRLSTFFINGQGIEREVITTDICRYLGNNALVRPGTHVVSG